MVRIRLRMPSGQQTADVSTYGELTAIIDASLGGQAWTLLTGYPPAPMQASPASGEQLGEYIKSGETVVVKISGPAPAPPEAAKVPSTDVSDPVQPTFQPPPQSAFAASAFASAGGAVPSAFAASARSGDADEEEQLRIALALSLGETSGGGGGGGGAGAAQSQSSASTQPQEPAVPSGNGGAPTEGERLIRRVIPADNSCLFAAIAHAFEGSAGRRERADALRKLVADAVLANPTEYSEAMLGRPPEEYVRWIQEPSNWGGGIEVAILAEHFQSEIAAFDVQTQRVDVFGQGKGRSTRAYLLYDGVHYDLIVKQLFDGAPEDCDVTIFDSSDDSATMLEARMLVAEQNKARKFTDTGNFTLRCLVCQRGLVGQEGAMAHAKETGHSNFCEYK